DAGHRLSFVSCKRDHLQIGENVEIGTPGDPDCLSFANCGYPVNDCLVRIADDEDNVLPPSYVGNIQVKGKNVTGGYYKQPDHTALFTADGWLRTGDVGFTYNDHLIITGRKKNIIIVNGQNYYPHDIEQLIERELDIRPGSIVAIGVSSPHITARVAIFVLFKGNIGAFRQQAVLIRELLAARMDIYPDYILPIRSIPKTTSGKVMHFRLKEDLIRGTFNGEIALMQQLENDLSGDPGSEDISGLLAKVLKQVGVGSDVRPDESLFNAALSSLKALSLINALSRHKFDISFSMLYEAGSINNLETLLKQQKKEHDYIGRNIKKSPYETVYPLSWGQKQIYVAHMMAPESANMNICFAVDMKGHLEEEILQQAFQLLIRNNDVLRTAIQWKDNEPMQVLFPAEEVQPVWVTEDLTAEINPDALLQKQKQRIARMPFNIEQAPLCRSYLAKVSADTWVFVLSIHHIISDGWSIQLIGKELAALYQLLKNGMAPEPVSEKIQYKDFVFWQQQLLLTEKYQQNRLFWEKYLRDVSAGFRIPVTTNKHTVPEKEMAQGAVFKKHYAAGTTAAINTLAYTHGVSFFSVIISAISLLINKYNYAGTDDMMIGIDTAGRTHPQLEDQIGYFLHVLPVNVKLENGEHYVNFLKKIHQDLLLIYDHQTCHIEEVNTGLQKVTDFSTYNVLVIFQNFEQGLGFDTVFADLETSTAEIENDTCLNDLLFEFSINEDILSLKIKYNTTLYDEAHVSGICHHLGNIVQQVCERPLISVDQVALLLKEERERVLYEFNNTLVDWGTDMELAEFFENQVMRRPEAPALVCGDKVISYDELNQRADKVAAMVADWLGESNNRLVGISTGRNEWLVIGILGILKAGAAYVPVDPEYPEDRIRYVFESSDLRLLLTDGTVHAYGGKVRVCSIPDIITANEITSSTYSHKVPPDTPAYILYTSGSTGQPKGVMVSRSSLTNYIHAFCTYFNISKDDRVVLQSSIAFDTMVEELFPVLFKGGVLVLSEQGGRDIESLCDMIEREHVTVLSVTPLILNELNTRLQFPGTLRVIISGGDELLPSYVDRLLGKVALYNTYGPTETTVCATYFPVTDIRRTHIIGKPIANTQVYILDHTLQPQPVGVPGEICIAGAGVALGYLNKPELTHERFVVNPFGEGRLYRTGDIGCWESDGNVIFSGRRDTQVKIRGYRIELGEIEKCLLGSGLVDQVVVDVLLNDAGKTLVAYYTAKNENLVALREYLHTRLPYYMVPSFFVLLTQLPLTPNGKINRKLLPAPVSSPHSYHAPETPLERDLARLWENVLQRPNVSMNDDFFEIGGQSLKAIQVISRVFKEFSVKLELRDLFINPVFAQFTERVALLMWINTPTKSDLSNNIDEIII
uniref:amino acid adenylation domain-containing protein n=1 Tax=Chitinophaga sancti TaxID=1004 RepID=UPI003F797FB4